ncbi:hypothetical protein [Streptomyces sp. NPDC059639]|uniref:hypothetical protein n=1 Tax=Streptomyces sp. NPDC059639 TaxID=3346891 RepID=UPI003691A911
MGGSRLARRADDDKRPYEPHRAASDGADWVIPASGVGLSRNGNEAFSADDFGLTFTNREFGSALSD